MRVRLALTTTLIVAALSLSACGSGSGSDGSGSDGGGSSTTEAPASGGSGGGGGTAIKIADFAYDPTELDVKVGDTVTFTNDDDATHTATAKEGDPTSFDTGKLASGDSKGIAFDEAGDYAFYCSIHEYMTGTIHVVE